MSKEHKHCECGCECHHEHHHEHHGHGECDCGCGHEHGREQNKKTVVIKYSLGALPVVVGFMNFIPFYIPLICAVLGYVAFGLEVWSGMIRGFAKRKIFTEFTLMCVATLGAFAIGEYADAAALMYLYSLGETISDTAYSKSKKNISSLMELSPEYAVVSRHGEWIRVAPEEVMVGEKITVSAGERVPLDARVCEGGAEADTSSVTGEEKPLSLFEGVECPSGALVVGGSVVMVVTKEYQNSVVARLRAALDAANAKKSSAEKRISHFAAVFTPIAFCVAICVFAVGASLTKDVATWLRAAITVLVVSCPCSLVLSVPLTYFAGMGNAAKSGIVFRGGEIMDRCQHIGTLAFDKTGTLTEGTVCFDGAEVFGNMEKEQFLSLAKTVLVHSPHLSARAFVGACDAPECGEVTNIENIGGRGIVCELDGKRVLFGNSRLMSENGIKVPECQSTCIYGAYEERLVGRLDFSSHIKDGVGDSIRRLRELGVDRIALISGDTPAAVENVCKSVGIEEYYSLAAPDEKLNIFESISRNTPKGKYSAYCGDGLNDSAVIVAANVGIAMGGCGSALTVENADIVLMNDNPERIADAILISRKTARVAGSNIVLSLGIKIGVVGIGAVLAALGKNMPIELALMADVGAAVLTVLNSLRAARRVKNGK